MADLESNKHNGSQEPLLASEPRFNVDATGNFSKLNARDAFCSNFLEWVEEGVISLPVK